MIYFQLFITFLKIGLLSFGGGYGMIPVIQKELEIHNWMSPYDFIKIISISEMTPGPIAVNTATFVGYKIAGIFGGALATIGVVLPSFILIMATSSLIFKFKDHPLLEKVLYTIKPVVLALIIAAVIFIGKNTLLDAEIIKNSGINTNFLNYVDPISIIILIISILMLTVFKINPIIVLLASGIIAVILHLLGIF